ncbi:1-acylglycerol-3-phosphate O-acyltransferase [Shewanella cyperi]|uniref:1-acyl-sn-glycerol-3-phosphate acyltransferase n=1 Tax=Shewanella cyperi TaxID=2814292 RepID=A0A974XJR6_9GAMM|nr:1-acylglycerol-3-phosphate O-acyltransferase [Shewanella cyperi]QSX29579.1 1-acylglycerol-3-phosphate O-acyltransferase [Shewanella cyperi]
MLLIARSLLLALLLLLVFVVGSIACLLRPRHRDNVHMFARWFSAAAPILGVKLIVRRSTAAGSEPCIYLANHQNNYDIFTHTAAVPRGTVSLGKKSLAWMPLFGQIYWLSGNILIERNNRSRAFETMANTVRKIKDKCLSVWIFPEGTRSRGRGLLPFKAGAFHTAIAAGVPMVPVLASNQCHINLNRWDNGVVIIEMMDPIETQGLDRSHVKALSERIHAAMAAKLEALNQEAASLMQRA